MDMKQIRKEIEKLTGLSAWEIRRHRKKSLQRYLIFDQMESQRQVETEKFGVSLYTIRDQEGLKVLGESSLVLSEGDDIPERILTAFEMAGLIANPVFTLPGKGLIYEEVGIQDPDLRDQPLSYLDQIQEDLVAAPLPGVKRSSAEIYIEEKEFFLVNSNGLERGQTSSEILVEFVLLAEKGALLEGESQATRRVRFYKDLHLTEILETYARFAREAQEAGLPKSGTYPVVFSGEALDTLFNFFVLQSSGPAGFQNWSQFHLEQAVVQEITGDPLTLFSNPAFPWGLKSRSLDENGLPLQRVEVIRENIFKKRMNNKRYADYLQEEPTGDFSNIEVKSGVQSEGALLSGSPCYHLFRFSTFEPNPITGAFSGEIRTGYLIRDGRRQPVKGGSVSGRMQEAFRRAFFSNETTRREAYFGPAAVRIEKLEIAGE